ncbi:MAG: hypothetical protein ACI4MV_03300 [Christensenellales bacterium]
MEKVDTISQIIALRAGLSELADDADKLNKHQNHLDSLNHAFEDDCLQLNRNSREEEELAHEIEDIERGVYPNDIKKCDKRAQYVSRLQKQKQYLMKEVRVKPTLDKSQGFDSSIVGACVGIACLACIITIILCLIFCIDSTNKNLFLMIFWLPIVVKIISFIIALIVARLIIARINIIKYKKALSHYKGMQTDLVSCNDKCDQYIRGGDYLQELREVYTPIHANVVSLQKKVDYDNKKIDQLKEQIAILRQSIVERYEKLSTYYSPLLHQSDFDKIDYIIYLFDTNRCDTMRDALMQLDAQKRTDSLISAIGTAVQYINNNMNRTMRELGQSIQNSLANLAISINQSISSNNDMLNSRVAQLETSLTSNLNKSCQQLVDSINKVSTDVDVSVYLDKKRIN